MHQSVPIKKLSNGKYIWQDARGTYSHQRPESHVWCEGHQNLSEAFLCFQDMEREKSRKAAE